MKALCRAAVFFVTCFFILATRAAESAVWALQNARCSDVDRPEGGPACRRKNRAAETRPQKTGVDAAKRYKIDAYPTLLLLKADGTQVDRIVGFRDPAQFIVEFKQMLAMAQTGKSALEVARQQVAQQARPDAASGEPEEAQPRLDLAKKFLAAGKTKALLAKHVARAGQADLFKE